MTSALPKKPAMSGRIKTTTPLAQEPHPLASSGDHRMASIQGRHQSTSAISRRPYDCLCKPLLKRMFVALGMHCITRPTLRAAITRIMQRLGLRHV